MDGAMPQIYILLILGASISFILMLIYFIFKKNKVLRNRILKCNVYLFSFTFILFLLFFNTIIGSGFLNYIIFPEALLIYSFFIYEYILFHYGC